MNTKLERVGAVGVPTAAGLGVLFLSGTSAFFFPPWLGLWTLGLALATHRLPPLGTAVLFFVVSIDLVRPVFGGIFVSYSELEFAACLLAWSAWRATNRLRSNMDWGPLIWSAPFLVVLLTTSLLNSGPTRGLALALRMSEMFFAFLMCADCGFADRNRRFSRISVAGAAVFYAISGLLQFTTASNTRVFSFFDNANQFGGYLAIILPVTAALLLAEENRTVRIAWLAIFSVAALALLATQSRAAMGAGFLGASVVGWLFFRHRAGSSDRRSRGAAYAALNLAGVALAIALVFWALVAGARLLSPGLNDRLDQAVQVLRERSQIGIDGVLLQRLPYWRVGFEIWKEHPVLGIGPGNLPRTLDGEHRRLIEANRPKDLRQFYSFRNTVRLHLHSLYVQLLVETGLAGLAAFLWFLFRAAAHFRRQGGSVARLGGTGLLTAFLAHNLVDVTFPSLGLETGILLGFLAAHGLKPRGVAPLPPGGGDWRAPHPSQRGLAEAPGGPTQARIEPPGPFF